jgi:hypothetical protein
VSRAFFTALVLSLIVLTGIGVAGAAVIRGSNVADELTGTPRADQLDARGGNDRVAIHGDGRADRVRCGPGRDIVNADLFDKVAADCEVVSRQLSRDPFGNFDAQHETQVEPDTFAYGSTIVATFQSGRYTSGATSIGWTTSRDAGRTWKSGHLPRLTLFSTPPGALDRASDPAVAYDAVHRYWLISSLGVSARFSDIVVSRSRNGVSWTVPVTVAHSQVDDYDKEWIVCDNWLSSRFRGRCYLSYMNFTGELLETRTSSNGGRTWSAPTAVAVPRPTAVINGLQPVVRPDGSLVVVFAVWAALETSTNEIAAIRSTDGGATFSPAVRVSPLEEVQVSGMRAPPLPSVEVAGDGTVYVAWSDCRFSDQCTADIALARSRDGVTWAEPTRIPIGVAGAPVNRFLPGLAVDATTSGTKTRIAVLYHTLKTPVGCDPIFTCPGADVGLIVSRDAGATWARPQRLNATSMPLWWMPDAGTGRFLGDYVSTSWVRGRPVSVFALASEPTGGLFRQAVFASTRGTG